MGRVLNIVTILVLMLAGCAMGHYLKRVIGDDCPADKGQHHVVLTTPGDDKGHCGGSLLSPEWIITAAHCEKRRFKDGTFEIIKDLQVLIGKHPDKTKAIKKDVEARHKFKYTKAQVEHDIMLIKIDKLNTDRVVIVGLPGTTCSAPSKGERVDIVGWMTANVDPTTKAKTNIRHATQLQCGQLDVKPCGVISGCDGDPNYSKYHLLCGLDKSKQCDACRGDSGSSLIYNGELHGVLISGVGFFCSDTVDFIDICHKDYRAWISKTTGL